jgi:hypothetical protein
VADFLAGGVFPNPNLIVVAKGKDCLTARQKRDEVGDAAVTPANSSEPGDGPARQRIAELVRAAASLLKLDRGASGENAKGQSEDRPGDAKLETQHDPLLATGKRVSLLLLN